LSHRQGYRVLRGIDEEIEPELIQPEPRFFLSLLTAFRQINRKVKSQGLRGAYMYLPISLGGIVVIVLVLWLLGVV